MPLHFRVVVVLGLHVFRVLVVARNVLHLCVREGLCVRGLGFCCWGFIALLHLVFGRGWYAIAALVTRIILLLKVAVGLLVVHVHVKIVT